MSDNKGPGCFGVLAFMVISGWLIFTVIGSIPQMSSDKSEVCWVHDLAWPFEGQERNLMACAAITIKPQHSASSEAGK